MDFYVLWTDYDRNLMGRNQYRLNTLRSAKSGVWYEPY
jgi:hypothetical protein